MSAAAVPPIAVAAVHAFAQSAATPATAPAAGPSSRQLLIVGGLGLVLCALQVAVYFLVLRTSYSVLYRDLREADAATITAELERSHIDYRVADGGQTILVPDGAVDTTRLHVASRDLPLHGTVGFELFNNSSIGLSEFAQRIN